MSDGNISPLRVFNALLLRDLTVARRELVYFLVRTAMQPILFVLVFGFILPRMGQIPRGYTATILPGVLALSLAMAAIQSVSLPMIQDFGYTKEIEDRLLAPAPIEVVAIEKIVNGTIQGLIAAIVVLPIARLIMGPIPGLSYDNLGLLVVMAILAGAAFAALGLVLGTAIPAQQVGMMFGVVVGPMIMFGCTYYPWALLDHIPLMKYLVLINPLAYASEGMRAALTPRVPHMNVFVVLAVLVVVTAFMTAWGLKTFRKKALN